jgi:hypothetical protein
VSSATFASFRSKVRWIGTGAVFLHILFCLFLSGVSSEGSWRWFPAFIVDFPASLLVILATWLGAPTFIAFVTIGSVWWAFVIALGSRLYWKHWRIRDPAA